MSPTLPLAVATLTPPHIVDILKDVAEIMALAVGAVWAFYEVGKYRQFKNWLQLDVEKSIYKLANPINVKGFTWNKAGKREITPPQPYTHAIEAILSFTNVGKTRAKIYNVSPQKLGGAPRAELWGCRVRC